MYTPNPMIPTNATAPMAAPIPAFAPEERPDFGAEVAVGRVFVDKVVVSVTPVGVDAEGLVIAEVPPTAVPDEDDVVADATPAGIPDDGNVVEVTTLELLGMPAVPRVENKAPDERVITGVLAAT